AEDGIRDPLVTGVQTCALPILLRSEGLRARFGRKSKNTQPGKNRHESYSHQDHVWEATGIKRGPSTSDGNRKARPWDACTALGRSEERRVGKERRSGGPREGAE